MRAFSVYCCRQLQVTVSGEDSKVKNAACCSPACLFAHIHTPICLGKMWKDSQETGKSSFPGGGREEEDRLKQG